MPIYEFKCLKCGEVFEIMKLSSSDEVKMECPGCGSEDFERVLSSTNYIFGQGGGSKVTREERSCGSGTCTTYEIPGMSR